MSLLVLRVCAKIPVNLRVNVVKVGGYATAQNTTVEILGVPVVWLPWLIFPVKTERETGVLFPHFGLRGDAGLGAGLPLFWAAR